MKRTLVVLLILAGLGSYVYFVEIKGAEKKERVERQTKRLLKFPETGISKVHITNQFGEIHLRKTGDQWLLASPVSAPADDAAVNALISTLISAETKSTVGEDDPASFGLQPPKITIVVEGDGESETIKIGKRSPVGQDLYVQRGDAPTIFLATGALDDTPSKKADEFREKRVFSFNADAVTAITLKNRGKVVELRRKGTSWIMEVDGQHQNADDGIAAGLAQDLANLRLTKWSAENATPADIANAGLKSPGAAIDIELTDGQRHTLLFGKTAGNDQSAKVAARSQIIEIAAWSTQQLLKSPEDLRNRQLISAAPEAVHRLVLRTGNEPELVLQRTGDAWDVSGAATGKANAERVQGILTALTEMRANEFRPSTPATRTEHNLAPALRSITAFDAGGKQVGVINFGKLEEDWAVWVQTADKGVEAKVPNDFVKNKWPYDPKALFTAPEAEPTSSPDGHP